MAFYDIDKNGNVTEEEFVKQLDRRNFNNAGMPELEKRRFRAVDKNGDGLLDKEEFYPFLYPRYYKEYKSFWFEEIFQAFDVDSDGTVSFSDYLRLGVKITRLKNVKGVAVETITPYF